MNILATEHVFKVIKVVVWLGNGNVGRSGRLRQLSARVLMKMVTHKASSSLSVMAKSFLTGKTYCVSSESKKVEIKFCLLSFQCRQMREIQLLLTADEKKYYHYAQYGGCVCVYLHEALMETDKEKTGTLNLRKDFLFIEEGSNCPCVFKEDTGGSEIHKCFESEKK